MKAGDDALHINLVCMERLYKLAVVTGQGSGAELKAVDSTLHRHEAVCLPSVCTILRARIICRSWYKGHT